MFTESAMKPFPRAGDIDRCQTMYYACLTSRRWSSASQLLRKYGINAVAEQRRYGEQKSLQWTDDEVEMLLRALLEYKTRSERRTLTESRADLFVDVELSPGHTMEKISRTDCKQSTCSCSVHDSLKALHFSFKDNECFIVSVLSHCGAHIQIVLI